MITSQEAKDFFLLKTVNTEQECAVLRRFLYDLKQIDVGIIRIRNDFMFTGFDLNLLAIALDHAKLYYYQL